jgi:hypothetical protein
MDAAASIGVQLFASLPLILEFGIRETNLPLRNS